MRLEQINLIAAALNYINDNVECRGALAEACVSVRRCECVPSCASWPDSELCDDVQRPLGRRLLTFMVLYLFINTT